jgi:hypothetical protein
MSRFKKGENAWAKPFSKLKQPTSAGCTCREILEV